MGGLQRVLFQLEGGRDSWNALIETQEAVRLERLRLGVGVRRLLANRADLVELLVAAPFARCPSTIRP
jgi:hypothetical protein